MSPHIDMRDGRASSHYRFRAVMWGAIGVAAFATVAAVILRLDPRIAGYVAGTLVLVCLGLCVLSAVIDSGRARGGAPH